MPRENHTYHLDIFYRKKYDSIKPTFYSRDAKIYFVAQVNN